ncbi:hypothetical protein Aph01nite_76340 [Acrocarpospora phusangensis]|uniref:Terpene synthase n=1 Tax=Acrocarpospora phusangensis TaxID=1070424 RepID=A0A919QHT3_9ACTN|nr:terpene synthase family protein [Acrocarpospora phusangensis]GIH29324.1 hypothetical protein Aph01nite_76340 [Acrocarpospora phusangensis]
MPAHLVLPGGARTAAEAGRTCALAAACERFLRERAAAYPELFPERPFGSRLYSMLALANAFGSPDALGPEDLRALLRASIWVFALDFQVDYVAKSAEDVARVTADCQAVAAGGDPATPLTRLLAEIRDEIPAIRRDGWRDLLSRTLEAMATEWAWRPSRREGAPPTVAEYLANSASATSSFVNLTHWLATGHPRVLAHLEEAMAASDAVQRVLRLVNDLAGEDRDHDWDDVNVLTLGIDRAEVIRLIGLLLAESGQVIEPLRTRCPEAADYLERQIGFSVGFYGTSDYWGDL